MMETKNHTKLDEIIGFWLSTTPGGPPAEETDLLEKGKEQTTQTRPKPP